MKYKLLALGAVSFMSLSAAMAADKPKSGFNVGLQGGYVSHSGTLSHKQNLNPKSAGTDSSNISGSSGDIGIFVGYMMNLSSNVFAGVDIYAQYQSAEGDHRYHTTTNIFTTTKVKMKETFGANLMLGMHHGCLSPFIKLGYANTKFELNSETVSGALKFSNKKSNRKGGFLLGLGADYRLNKNWSLGAEWTHTWYSSISNDYARGRLGNSYKPRVSNVNLRLKYSF